MNIIVVVPPAYEPVTLAEARMHLRLTANNDSPPTHPHDEMLSRHIASARGDAERITRRAFVEQRLLLTMDRFPKRGYIELLRPPVSNVLSVSYYDEEQELQVVDSDDYFVTDDFVPRLQFETDFQAPSVFPAGDSVRVEYLAGYPPEGSPPDDYTANVPAEIKNAILFGVELLYSALKPDERTAIERTRDALLDGFVVTTL